MSSYGAVAVRATGMLRAGGADDPAAAWEVAVAEQFPDSRSCREKGCPRAAFVGLCHAGLVLGVPPSEGRPLSGANATYAVAAVSALRRSPALATAGAAALWRSVTDGVVKRHNGQMHVVLALWRRGLIVNDGAGCATPR